MRDYQRKKNNPYRLPHNVYKQVLYMVMDYDRLRGERADILHGGGAGDRQPRGGGLSDPTQSAALRLGRIAWQLDAIEDAVNELPAEYRRGVLNNVLYGAPYPLMLASEKTWKRWRARYIWQVARKAGLA